MRFKRGDSVLTLVERGTAREGDVGVIDAIHPGDQSYTVGFYATEDALLYSGRFHDDELAPHAKKPTHAILEEGDVVELLSPLPSLEKGAVGQVSAVLENHCYAVAFAIPSMSIPLLVPVPETELKKLGHNEESHHHH